MIRILKKEEYIISYGIENAENFKKNSSLEYTSAFSVDINFSDVETILKHKYIIDPKLRELSSRGFISIESKNLKYTLFALVAGFVINAIGFWLQWHIANNINNVIEFANFEDLKYIAELIKNLK